MSCCEHCPTRTPAKRPDPKDRKELIEAMYRSRPVITMTVRNG